MTAKYQIISRQISSDQSAYQMELLALSLELLIATNNIKAYREFELQYHAFLRQQTEKMQQVLCTDCSRSALVDMHACSCTLHA